MVLRASPHKREEKERVRSTLLRAALELGAAHGFASLGLREVARAANIAPTSFYRHFADMGELGRILVEEQVAQLLTELAARVQAGQVRATASGLIDTLLTSVERQPELVRFLVSERVGAFAGLRELLAAKLALLGTALRAVAPARTEIALALIVDAFARALDSKERDVLRQHLIDTLATGLGEP